MNCDELFKFEKIEGGYALTKFLGKKDGAEIEIPSEYNGLPMLTVESAAFRGTPLIASVYIPDGCTVKANAFSGCRGLRRARVGGTSVARETFFYCRSLESVMFSEDVRTIETAAFADCASLKSVTLPGGLERIGKGAFHQCKGLEEIVFPDREIKIEPAAFFGCQRLPAETLLYSFVGAIDTGKSVIQQPMVDWRQLFRRDVFALAVERGCLRGFDRELLFRQMKKYDLAGLVPLADMLPLAEELLTLEIANELIGYSSRQGSVEATAWLLDYKNRKFGYNTEDNYEF